MQEAMLSVIVDGHHLTIEDVVAVAKAEKVSFVSPSRPKMPFVALPPLCKILYQKVKRPSMVSPQALEHFEKRSFPILT
jgi:hypothetical protein